MPKLHALTPRELEVLRLVADGLADKEIASQLEITPGSASNYVASVLVKLDSRNRTEAVLHALRQGIIDNPSGEPYE